MGSRRPSHVALAALCDSHELCGGCLSRCATHDSLTRLDEEVAGFLDAAAEDETGALELDANAAAAAAAAAAADAKGAELVVRHSPFGLVVERTPPTHAALGASPPRARRGSDGGSSWSSASRDVVVDGAALPTSASHRCELCTEVAVTWRTIVSRVLKACGACGLAYILWLRFVASKETARRHLYAITRVLGRLLFNYRVRGLEHIPSAGPAILCNYHGFIPLDMYFFHEYVARVTGRTPTTLVADFVFQIPLFSYFVRVCGGVPASRKNALKALRAGGLVLVAPGGVREAMTSSAEDYVLRWFGRKGFAEMACATGAPVLPMFTSGIREVFLVLGGSLKVVQKLYKLTRLPFTPFIGPLPQALTSIVGAPILPRTSGAGVGGDPAAEQLAQQVMEALSRLMRRGPAQ